MNGTFSRRTQGTGRVSSKRHTSPTSPEFAPSIPAVLPAWLRSWQGKPPTKRSTLDGIFSTFRTSSSRGSEGKQFRALPARAGRSRRASWFRDRRGRGRVRDHQRLRTALRLGIASPRSRHARAAGLDSSHVAEGRESVLSPFLDSSRLLCGDHVFSVSIVPRGADTRAGFRLLVAQMARAGQWVGRARRDGQARQPVTGPRPWAGSAATLQG